MAVFFKTNTADTDQFIDQSSTCQWVLQPNWSLDACQNMIHIQNKLLIYQQYHTSKQEKLRHFFVLFHKLHPRCSNNNYYWQKLMIKKFYKFIMSFLIHTTLSTGRNHDNTNTAINGTSLSRIGNKNRPRWLILIVGEVAVILLLLERTINDRVVSS